MTTINEFIKVPAPSDCSLKFQNHIQNMVTATINKNSQDSLNLMLREHFENPGKMIRPSLVYNLGLLQTVNFDHLAAWATTCELLHNATIIHDDLQDRDIFRRGQVSLWAKYGEKQAINAGDFLLLAALQPVLDSDIDELRKNKLLLNFSHMACKIVNGQNLEFELNQISSTFGLYENYLRCISLKTAALFADLARGVNIIMPEPFASDQFVGELFSKIGNLYQMFDDVIDLYGNKQRDAKGCDIKEGKISFLFATHMQRHPEDFNLIMPILRKPRTQTTPDNIDYVKGLYQQRGTVDKCLEEIRKIQQEIQMMAESSSPKLQAIVEALVLKITSQPLSYLGANECSTLKK